MRLRASKCRGRGGSGLAARQLLEVERVDDAEKAHMEHFNKQAVLKRDNFETLEHKCNKGEISSKTLINLPVDRAKLVNFAWANVTSYVESSS